MLHALDQERSLLLGARDPTSPGGIGQEDPGYKRGNRAWPEEEAGPQPGWGNPGDRQPSASQAPWRWDPDLTPCR